MQPHSRTFLEPMLVIKTNVVVMVTMGWHQHTPVFITLTTWGSSARAVLTLIIAFEVIRKRVALSLTALIFSPPSRGIFSPSSSLRDRCRAAPCLAIRSLHVLRSSSLLTSILRVPWISLRSDWAAGSSSPESSGRERSEVSKHTFLLQWHHRLTSLKLI